MKSMIAMGHSLGLTVLAEGVETPEQLAILRERGCDSYQGCLCAAAPCRPSSLRRCCRHSLCSEYKRPATTHHL